MKFFRIEICGIQIDVQQGDLTTDCLARYDGGDWERADLWYHHDGDAEEVARELAVECAQEDGLGRGGADDDSAHVAANAAVADGEWMDDEVVDDEDEDEDEGEQTGIYQVDWGSLTIQIRADWGDCTADIYRRSRDDDDDWGDWTPTGSQVADYTGPLQVMEGILRECASQDDLDEDEMEHEVSFALRWMEENVEDEQ